VTKGYIQGGSNTEYLSISGTSYVGINVATYCNGSDTRYLGIVDNSEHKVKYFSSSIQYIYIILPRNNEGISTGRPAGLRISRILLRSGRSSAQSDT
jgi:hypothetical protein